MAAAWALLLSAGCGLKKAPQPYSAAAPVPGAFQLRQIGDEVLVSWEGPREASLNAQGGLRAHLLWLDELEPGCPSCPPLNEMRFAFESGSPNLIAERDTVYYRFRPERPESGWRARAAFRFGRSEGRSTATLTVPGMSAIPRPLLRWEWPETPGRAAPEIIPSVRLSWDPVQERVVHIVEAGSPPGERTLYYRANVYVRTPGTPWRIAPVNAAPLEAATWVGGPSRGDIERGGNMFEYAIRWVNAIGGEGPLSEPVRVRFTAERAR